VYWPIYVEKIGGQPCGYKIRQKLGAWETDLSLVKNFFPEGDLSQMPLVSKKSDQSWLLNGAGLALLTTGRPKEAEEALKTAIDLYVEDNQIAYASVSYQNLADLQFRSGELASGLESAKNALDAAEKAKSDQYVVNSKAYIGWILHLMGKSKEAENESRQADELQLKIDGDRLYSLIGVNYADFLISLKRIDEAFELTRANLEICQKKKWINDISSCRRCLGAIERIKGNHKGAEDHLQKAIEIARKVGVQDFEIEALFEFSRLHLDMERYENAIR
jgi:tetratricopeptide (TPR) repeat protein